MGFEGDFRNGFLAVFFLTGALMACVGRESRDRDETARGDCVAATRTLGFGGDFFLTTIFVLAGALAALDLDLDLSWSCCY